ncbi:hypothetical protein GQ457_03G021650 [Hibiscus cannabinus]
MVSEIPVVRVAADGSSSSAVRDSKPFTNKSISIRLDETNYLLWRQHVLFTIESLDLSSHIDGTSVLPPQYVLVNGEKVPNPHFASFKQQDSALCSWLLASISLSILPSLVSCRIAFEIWEKVQQVFSISSTTKIMHLHCSLKNLRKRDQGMREYLAQIQSVCDSLAACGNPLSETMHISAILSGLPSEYEPVVAVITSSQQPYKLDGVCGVLLDTEARLQETHYANLVQNSNLGYDGYQFGGGGSNTFFDQSYYPFVGQVSSGTTNSASQKAFSDSRSYSQNPSYLQNPSYSQNSFSQRVYQTPSFFRGSEITDYPKAEGDSSHQEGAPAFVSEEFSPVVCEDTAWFPDSEATAHLTPDLGKFITASPYTSSGKITVANGMVVPTSHIGRSSLATDSRSLFLSNLLHVPCVNKNLLSVSRFTKDNNVSVEFFPNSCVVKDLGTQQVMLRGLESNGLYKFFSKQDAAGQQDLRSVVSCKNGVSKHVASAFTVTKPVVSNVELWHRRLGHPSYDTLCKTLYIFPKLSLVSKSVQGRADFSPTSHIPPPLSSEFKFPTKLLVYKRRPKELLSGQQAMSFTTANQQSESLICHYDESLPFQQAGSLLLASQQLHSGESQQAESCDCQDPSSGFSTCSNLSVENSQMVVVLNNDSGQLSGVQEHAVRESSNSQEASKEGSEDVSNVSQGSTDSVVSKVTVVGHPMLTRSKTGSLKNKVCFSAVASMEIAEPKTVQQALASKEYTWYAYKSEFFGLFRTWLYSPNSDFDVVIKLFTVEARGTGKTSFSWLIILSLYSRLTCAEHELVFSPTPKGRRKTVVTTNVEVGSLTLEGIVYIFYSGFSKQRFYNLSADIESLILATLSKMSAKQRADKAGRTRTGKCYRWYSTKYYLNAMFVQGIREIQKSNIVSCMSWLETLGISNILGFGWSTSPYPESMIQALEILCSLGGHDEHVKLTSLASFQVNEVSLESMVAKMLSSNKFGCLNEIITLIVVLFIHLIWFSIQGAHKELDKVQLRFVAIEGDHVTFQNIYIGFLQLEKSFKWCHMSQFLDFDTWGQESNATRGISMTLSWKLRTKDEPMNIGMYTRIVSYSTSMGVYNNAKIFDPWRSFIVTATRTRVVQQWMEEKFQRIVYLRTPTRHNKLASARYDFCSFSASENKLKAFLQILESNSAKTKRAMGNVWSNHLKIFSDRIEVKFGVTSFF